MPRKYVKAKYSTSSVSGFLEVLDSDEEDVPLLAQNMVKSTSRHITITADSAAASKKSRKTRFTEESEMVFSTMDPTDECNMGDITVPPEFETWLEAVPPDDFHGPPFEEGDSSTRAHDDEDEASDEGNDDADPSFVHDIADHVASVEANMNKSQRVRLLFCLYDAVR